MNYNQLKENFDTRDELKNLYTNCTLNKREIFKELKKIKVKKTLENNKKEKTKINLKIPINIQDAQKIIVFGEGHRKNGVNGNLVITINLK